MSLGQDALQAARDEARRVLGEAIEYRREHPYVFYLFHRSMATLRRNQRRLLAAWWHRQWRDRYWAKTMATREATRCASRHPDPTNEGVA